MEEADRFWLAGFLEGEGSFLKGPPSRKSKVCISAVSTDIDIIERVANLLEANYYDASDKRWNDNPHWKKPYVVNRSGRRAVELMQELRPLMGQRRQRQIDEAIECFNEHACSRGLTEQYVLQIIKEYRQGNISQAALAEKHSMRRETINKIVNGKSKRWGYLVE